MDVAVAPDDELNANGREIRQIVSFLKRKGNEAFFEEFRRLHEVSDLRAAWSIARQWLIIAAAAALALSDGRLWAYAIAILVISTRQHALGIVMHEATHYRLFSRRWANEVLADLVCAFPINMTVSPYRYEHRLHHRHNMTEEDPYFQAWSKDDHWFWPKTRTAAFWLFAKDLLSLNMYRLGPALYQWSPWVNHFSTRPTPPFPPGLTVAERTRLYLFAVGLIGALTYYHA